MSIRLVIQLLALMSFSASALLLQTQARRQQRLGSILQPWRPLQLTQAGLALFFLSISLSGILHPTLLSVAGLLGCLLTFAGVGMFLHRYAGVRYAGGAYIAASALLLAIFYLHFWMPQILIGATILQFSALLHLGIEFFVRRTSVKHRLGATPPMLLRKILREAALVSACFFPFLVLDPLGSQLGWNQLGLLIEDYSLPLYATVLNSIVAIRIVQSLEPTPQNPEPDPGGPAQPPPPTRQLLTSLQGTITAREFEVARLIVEGRSAKDIAAQLHLSIKTVENHTSTIYKKTGVQSRFEFISRYS